MADRAGGVNSFSSFNSYSGWIEVNIPPPPVALRELEVDLRRWPGVPRCAVAELERAGVPREEAMARVREHYREPSEQSMSEEVER